MRKSNDVCGRWAGAGSIPHIARTLVAKPGRRLAPVVIFNSGAVGIVPCASCLLGGLLCPGAKPHQAVTPLARTAQCLSPARTKHHRPSPITRLAPSPLRCRPEALLCSALPCPALLAPSPHGHYSLLQANAVFLALRTCRWSLACDYARLHSVLCVSDVYMQAGSGRCAVFSLTSVMIFTVLLSTKACTLFTCNLIGAGRWHHLIKCCVYSTALRCTMCPDNSTVNSRQSAKAPH